MNVTEVIFDWLTEDGWGRLMLATMTGSSGLLVLEAFMSPLPVSLVHWVASFAILSICILLWFLSWIVNRIWL